MRRFSLCFPTWNNEFLTFFPLPWFPARDADFSRLGNVTTKHLSHCISRVRAFQVNECIFRIFRHSSLLALTSEMNSPPRSNTEKDCFSGLKQQPHHFSHYEWASSWNPMDWLGLHIDVSCPATSESRGDGTSIQVLYLRLHRKCLGKAVCSG